jgi:hypothetical protein
VIGADLADRQDLPAHDAGPILSADMREQRPESREDAVTDWQ